MFYSWAFQKPFFPPKKNMYARRMIRQKKKKIFLKTFSPKFYTFKALR